MGILRIGRQQFDVPDEFIDRFLQVMRKNAKPGDSLMIHLPDMGSGETDGFLWTPGVPVTFTLNRSTTDVVITLGDGGRIPPILADEIAIDVTDLDDLI